MEWNPGLIYHREPQPPQMTERPKSQSGEYLKILLRLTKSPRLPQCHKGISEQNNNALAATGGSRDLILQRASMRWPSTPNHDHIQRSTSKGGDISDTNECLSASQVPHQHSLT